MQHPRLEFADGNRAGIGDLLRARGNATTIDAAGQPLANWVTIAADSDDASGRG